MFCEHRGRETTVDGWTDAPIPWPAYRGLTGRLTPLLCGDLVRAVRHESAQAVSYWFGVSRYTVRRWRRDLGVGRFTEGTRRLWKELAIHRLPLAARRRGAIASKLKRS